MILPLTLIVVVLFAISSTETPSNNSQPNKSAYAQNQENTKFSRSLNTYLQNFTDIETLDNAINTFFEIYAHNTRGLSSQGSDKMNNYIARVDRAGHVKAILENDINNDGIVTPVEIKFAQQELIKQHEDLEKKKPNFNPSSIEKLRQTYSKAFEIYMRHDTNKDGEITFDEMRALNENAYPYKHDHFSTYDLYLTFDKNHDGIITQEESTQALHKAFYILDANRDNVISDQERRAFEQNYYCAFRQPSPQAQIIGLSLYHGPFNSLIATDGQREQISAGYIEIEPGTRPIYLTISSYDVLWKLGGDVSRIEHINLIHYKGGLEGAPADKVTLRNSDDFLNHCPSSEGIVTTPGDFAAETIFDKVRISLGLKAPIKFFNGRNLPTQKLAAIYIPSRTTESFQPDNPPTSTLPKSLFEPLSGSHPNSFLRFNLNKIISFTSAEPFKILPEEIGLKQLLIYNYIEPIKSDGRRHYRIIKPFEALPAGFRGAGAPSFYLKKGIKPPMSNHTKACIYDEETKRPILGQPRHQMCY